MLNQFSQCWISSKKTFQVSMCVSINCDTTMCWLGRAGPPCVSCFPTGIDDKSRCSFGITSSFARECAPAGATAQILGTPMWTHCMHRIFLSHGLAFSFLRRSGFNAQLSYINQNLEINPFKYHATGFYVRTFKPISVPFLPRNKIQTFQSCEAAGVVNWFSGLLRRDPTSFSDWNLPYSDFWHVAMSG